MSMVMFGEETTMEMVTLEKMETTGIFQAETIGITSQGDLDVKLFQLSLYLQNLKRKLLQFTTLYGMYSTSTNTNMKLLEMAL